MARCVRRRARLGSTSCPERQGRIGVSMRRVAFGCILLTLPGVATAQTVEEQIAEAVLAAPESLRDGATVIVRNARRRPSIIRQGTNALVCEPDGPGPGFGVECYHKSFQDVMDWTNERLAAGARSFADMFIDGGPMVEVSPGAMQYALVGPTREEAVREMSIHLPYATAGSTGLPTEERVNGPWLMWGGTRAAHIMFGERPLVFRRSTLPPGSTTRRDREWLSHLAQNSARMRSSPSSGAAAWASSTWRMTHG